MRYRKGQSVIDHWCNTETKHTEDVGFELTHLQPVGKWIETLVTLKKHVPVGSDRLFDIELIYSRIIGVQASARNLNLQDLFSYELAPVPTSMFKDSGAIRFMTDKVKLKRLQVETSVRTILIDATVIDGSALLWIPNWTTKGTVADLIPGFKSLIEWRLRHGGGQVRLDVWASKTAQTKTGHLSLTPYHQPISNSRKMLNVPTYKPAYGSKPGPDTDSLDPELFGFKKEERTLQTITVPDNSVSGSTMEVCGMKKLEFSVGKKKFIQTFPVVEMFGPPIPILGMDLLQEMGATINFENGILKMDDCVTLSMEAEQFLNGVVKSETKEVQNGSLNDSVNEILDKNDLTSEWFIDLAMVNGNGLVKQEDLNTEIDEDPGRFIVPIEERFLDEQQHLRLDTLLGKFDSLFSQNNRNSIGEHSILTDSPPIYQRPYKIAMDYEEKVAKKIDEMLENGIIQHSSSSWCNPLVNVIKDKRHPDMCGFTAMDEFTPRISCGCGIYEMLQAAEQKFWVNQPPLIKAIFSGNVDKVQELLYCKENVNSQDIEGRSPLHAAAHCGNEEIVDILMLSGARTNTKDCKWLTPLHRACAVNNGDVVLTFLQHKADVKCRDKNWQTPLHIAAANNSVSCANFIIPVLNNIDISDRAGRTSLHHAAYNGYAEMVKLLLTHGANINSFDKKDRRAIHWGAFSGEVDVVSTLVNYGAEINVRDKEMYTPLHVASAAGNVNVVHLLISLGVEIDAVNAFGNTPLHIACLNGHYSVTDELIKAGACVDAVNNINQTPLHYAASSTHAEKCLYMLLEEGASVNAQSKDGRSPLHMTSIYGRFMRALKLIQSGAMIDCMDKDGCTALHIAAMHGHDLLIHKLLNHGADPNKHGLDGMTPLHMAALKGHIECCRKLLQAGVLLDTLDDHGRTCIHLAAYGGNIECLELLISSRGNFNITDKFHRLPLHYAASRARYQCIMTLITCYTKFNYVDCNGCSALHYAAASDSDGRCVTYLLNHHLDANIKDGNGFSPAHYAAANGNRQALEKLLDVSALTVLTQRKSFSKTTPLHLAAYNGHDGCLNVLLTYTSAFDQKDQDGRTALHLAASNGHTNCIAILLQQGASSTMCDKLSQRTPLHSAAYCGHIDCVKLLLSKSISSAQVNCVDAFTRTALCLAVMNSHLECALLLIKKGANVDSVDQYGMTPLSYAAIIGNKDCIEALLINCANALHQDNSSKTSLHLTAACGHTESLRSLLKGHPAEHLTDKHGYTPYQGSEVCTEALLNHYGKHLVNVCDRKGRTLAHAATACENTDCLNLLIKNGADINKQDEAGLTPLMLAAKNGNVPVIELLLDYKAKISLSDNDENTALHYACLSKQEIGALALLKRIDNPEILNLSNIDLKTCLHISARQAMVATTKTLLIKGANVLAIDCQGCTPLLACAPTSDSADCMAMIHAMMPTTDNRAVSYSSNSRLSVLTQSVRSSSICCTNHQFIDPDDDYENLNCCLNMTKDSNITTASHQSSDSEFY
ncbi:Serine/threonine-protein phosphatase 6 regulatory ankyrin repeat subunit A [Nymphon striatum]|nr:Serine/threonine-protein phosphatase 6 regulatory ankyrin repeat subunit A [Nymphon striatum]